MKSSALKVFLALILVSSACSESRLHVTPGEELPDGASTTGDSGRNPGQLPEAPVFQFEAGVPTDAPAEPDGPDEMNDGPPAAVCGNGKIEEGESCDDGDSRPGDGCSGICRLEPNYVCPTPGQACKSTIVCGDGKVMGSEACDDGNTKEGDGCSANCQVESGYACSMPGKMCTMVPTAKCGDGVVNQGEACDDGNVLSNDGCSATCTLEPGFSCPTPNKSCVKDEYCGDGRLNGTEQCDDGNITPGDGCSGACKVEPFFECKTPGMLCKSTIVCGDSKVIGDEACDDGNTKDGDGCSMDCKRVEPGYSCPTAAGVGGACTMVPMDRCGDGRLSYGEYCDDGNVTDNDGCSSACKVEAGYTCPTTGMLCKKVEWCGNGKLSIADGEQCDDGNMMGGDGCSPQCVVEVNYVCPVPGQPCQSTVRCGDKKVTGGETCDDGNLTPNDGCSASCQVEMGWTCPSTGGNCRPTRCGDGMKVGSEQCDDGNPNDNDGCSSKCVLEGQDGTGNGWVCPTPNMPCTKTTCGNGTKEGSEACDDGNDVVGDGCTPFCQLEPTCPATRGACHSRCGDGLILPSDQEQCDDGNNRDGDGCSSTCRTETGYSCPNSGSLPDTLNIPVVFRDVISLPASGKTRHPDFEAFSGDDATVNLVKSTLGTDGKPVFNGICTSACRLASDKDNGQPICPAECPYRQQLTTEANFNQWYNDTNGINIPVVSQLPLVKQMDGSYFFPNGDPNKQLYPLDMAGWVANGSENLKNGHNYGFTSEVRYWFLFKGGETLKFSGDDDVWVFINRQMVIDLGGLHPRKERTVTLDDAKATALGLVPNNIYEFVLFHAERHTNESNFNLTLNGFASAKSSCSNVCGDGIVVGTEACDLGTAQNTGAYGTCNADCTLPPRCGDGVMQSNEQCDDGLNLSTYGGAGNACAPGCVWAPRCGDGKVDSANGEACDEGMANGTGYGHCTAKCQLGARCGDGLVTDAEECDDGTNNGTVTSACTTMCKKKCGNGVLDAKEQCDDGSAKNVGGYGKCNPDCTLGPRCGDGIKSMPPETCDDGKNDGSYGTCTPMCQLGPRCGDGVVQATAGELCDLGTMNVASGYGKDKCTTLCRPAPYCGDHKVDGANGEKCDDGINSGMPGSCATDCSAAIPLPSCGDGTVQAPEQCDDGANNGAMASLCDSRCQKKCGNGFPDPGEQCDDGKNDGSYGTCNADCTLAGYCGDGKKNGTEGCDLGAGNEANPYGMGKCTKSCTVAPYCGDGRIQTTFGEECDGGSGCTTMCKKAIIE